MITKRELLDAIAECEKTPQNYQDCAKLATFYTIFDHLFPANSKERIDEAVIGNYGESEFLGEIAGADAKSVWAIIDELMSTLQAIQPGLYNGVMQKIREI